jgi:HPt (histidine-containing phosphotransfer) domain-containing protein
MMGSIMNDENFSQLDKNAFTQYFSGVEEKISIRLYLKTCTLFLNAIDERFKNLMQALADYNNQVAILNAHQIKGSLLSLGGTLLGETFRKVELGVNLEKNDDLIALLKSKKPDLDLFIVELKKWMNVLEARSPQH